MTAPGCVVRQLEVGLGTDVAQRPDRDLDGIGRTRRRLPLLLGDRRELVAGPRTIPLVHDVPDHLDPVAGTEQGPQRPRLVAEHPALEPQPLANRSMEELARSRRVEHQPWVGDQRLAPGLADVGPVVHPGDPGVHPVRPDPLANDGQGIGRHGGAVERGKRAGQHPVVAVEEGQPLAAHEREPEVARGGGPGVLLGTHQHDPRITIGQRLDQVGGTVGGGIVHDDALDGRVRRAEDGVEGTPDRAGGVPARDQDTDLGRGIGHGWVHAGDGTGEHTLARDRRDGPWRPVVARRSRALRPRSPAPPRAGVVGPRPRSPRGARPCARPCRSRAGPRA